MKQFPHLSLSVWDKLWNVIFSWNNDAYTTYHLDWTQRASDVGPCMAMPLILTYIWYILAIAAKVSYLWLNTSLVIEIVLNGPVLLLNWWPNQNYTPWYAIHFWPGKVLYGHGRIHLHWWPWRDLHWQYKWAKDDLGFMINLDVCGGVVVVGIYWVLLTIKGDSQNWRQFFMSNILNCCMCDQSTVIDL